ncbi:MAG TPA: hypothetical protein VGM80_04945 [Gaiellaceae bacterium]|jgi:hypothetical protein
MGVEAKGAEHGVEIRAFRGSRRSSVYREHVVSGRAFARVVAAGRERGLPILSAVAEQIPRELDPREARQLAREAEALEDDLRTAALAHHLAAISEVARWCARAPGRSWMTIVAS